MDNTILLFAFDILNPEMIIRYGGLTLLLLIIFAETGLFFGFFLPGDSLLFIAGLLSDSEYLDQPVGILIVLLIIAAVSGTCVGYAFGLWTGNQLKDKKDNLFYKKKYLIMTESFYQRYGWAAFIVGRYLPIIRTFVPILSGIIRVPFPRFFILNVVGAACWIVTLVMAGHWLGNLFPNLINHVEYIIVGLIIITAIPVIITYRKSKRMHSS